MTDKEKAKAYDEALEKASAAHKDDDRHLKATLERIFPELKESDDEKMRNFIINELACLRATDEKGSDRYEELTNAIGWLEKQGKEEYALKSFKDEDVRKFMQYIEKQAKAYGEDIKRTNKSYDNEITEEIFPELKENKDERIKKAIIEFFESEDDNTTYSLVQKKDIIAWLEKQGKEEYALKSFKDEDVRKFMQYIEKQAKAYEFNLPNRSYDIYAFAKDILVWLEKQGEQTSSQTNERTWLYLVSDVLTWKDGIGQYLDDPRVQELAKRLYSEYAQKLYNPSVLSNSSNTGKDEQKSADKIESKFHKGDWITIDKPCQIINIHDNGNYIVQYCDDEKTHELSKNFCESYFHFWTIQDAKDGDIIHFGTVTAIFKKYIGREKCICYCSFCKDGGFEIPIKNGEDNVYGCYNATPATKEQRDALMKAMNDAGYKLITFK